MITIGTSDTTVDFCASPPAPLGLRLHKDRRTPINPTSHEIFYFLTSILRFINSSRRTTHKSTFVRNPGTSTVELSCFELNTTTQKRKKIPRHLKQKFVLKDGTLIFRINLRLGKNCSVPPFSFSSRGVSGHTIRLSFC